MARARILKPEFFRSESLAKVSHSARLTFQGLWCEADAAGRGVAHPAILKGAIWPLDDDITPHVVEAHLQELSATRHIALYEIDGRRLYAIVNWFAHQSAAYRTGDEKYPAPPEIVQVARQVVQPARTTVHKGKGREGKGSICAPAETTAAPRAPKRPDPIWDALTEHFGPATTRTEQSNRGRQVRELREASATPADITARVNEHTRRAARRELNWTLTANALVTHWSDLAPRRNSGRSEGRIDPDTGAWLAPGL